MENTSKIKSIIRKARKRIQGIKYRAKNKELVKKNKRDYYLKNKERLCAKSRKYEKDNQEKVKVRKSRYREENKEYISEWKKNNYQENKELISIRNKKWVERNSDKVKEYKKEWANSEKGKESKRLDRAKRRALKVSTEDGTITKESLNNLQVSQDNKCYYCLDKLDFEGKNKVHLDHFYPLSKGGTHSINNVVWSCMKCNLSKGAIIPERLLI